MKILMLAEGMDIGGAETHVLTLIRALVKMKDEVTLVSMGGRYRDELRTEGIRCIDAPSGKRDPQSLRVCARILRELIKEGYDCIHAHTRGMATLVRRTTSMPLVVTAHLDFPVGPLRRALACFGDHTLAVSEDLSVYLHREYGVDRKDITITLNGIDTARFRECLGDCQTIVHVSRFDRGRTLAAILLCQIAPQLLSEYPKAKILLCGDGNEAKCIQMCANEANKRLGREGIVYLGGRTDIQNILREGAIFVGVSRCALEAMSVGSAVVLAGNDGYGGILTPESLAHHARSNFCARGEERADAERLLTDLRILLCDRACVQAYARAGRAFIEQHYTPARMAADAHFAYESAIAKRRGRVALLGFYGYGNLGDELTRSLLCERLPHGTLTTLIRGFGKNENEKNRFLDAKRTIRNSGTLVFGGGNLFQNTTSERSLFYYTSLLRYANARGCRTVLLGGGIGDFKNQRGRSTMQSVISCFDRIACRTESDCRFVEDLGGQKAEYLPDPCFLYEVVNTKHQETSEAPADHIDPHSIVLFVSGKQTIGRITFIKNARAVGYRLIFIPLFPKEDATTCRRLAHCYGGAYYPNLTVEDLTHLLCEVQLVISERLHGAILSLLAFTPAYLLADSTKARGLLSDCDAFCESKNLRSPLFPFSYYGQIHLQQNKKETEGQAFGFSELLSYFRSFYESDHLL